MRYKRTKRVSELLMEELGAQLLEIGSIIFWRVFLSCCGQLLFSYTHVHWSLHTYLLQATGIIWRSYLFLQQTQCAFTSPPWRMLVRRKIDAKRWDWSQQYQHLTSCWFSNAEVWRLWCWNAGNRHVLHSVINMAIGYALYLCHPLLPTKQWKGISR